ncbi:MAG: nuclear transport factor 2 family protein [Actinobacteria bacterium]|nr:nuclear transport factor 2 family protein [Actinomycetota bacterium]
MDRFVALVRRYVEDWLNAADPTVCEEILDPGYTVHISGQHLRGRDEGYIPATMRQLEQFPGLVVTVHDLLVGADRIAMRFSEHGASTRHEGREARWGGVALFRTDGDRFTEAFVEEDYLSRRAQLAGETAVAPGEPPASWDAPPGDPDPAAEDVVRRWLGARDADPAVAYDDMATGEAIALLDVAAAEVKEIFSSGPRVAFAATQRGGVPAGGTDQAEGALHSAGIVEVHGGRVVGGHVIRDQHGFQRALPTRGR